MSYRGEQIINGTIYVYEAEAIWDPVKKRSKQKRTYIGKRDPKTGEFIPNKRYYELYNQTPQQENANLSVIKSVDFGHIYLLDKIAHSTGLASILESVFPDCWQEILACAWYTITGQGPLYLCEQWCEEAALPDGIKLSSQRISVLLKKLDENRRFSFYKQWATLRMEKEYLAFDISSISSYSELIEYVEFGYNRDGENLPQVNLAMLFGETSRLPIFCRIYPGSIKDVSTLAGMVQFIDELKLNRMHYVMDRGFYSQKGIESLLKKRIKFAIGVPFTASIAKDTVRECVEEITSPSNAIQVNGQIIYAKTKMVKLNNRRVYVHVYFDEERHASERTVFMQKLLKLEEALRCGQISKDDQFVQKYFIIRDTKNGLHIKRNEEAIRKKTELNGYFVILTNDSKDPKYILELYRTKDIVEKTFNNLKNDLDLRRLKVHSDAAMEGRIFVGFIGLVFASYIRNTMRLKGLYEKYTFASLLLELKKLKRVHLSNGTVLTELSSKQKEIYRAFEIELPKLSSI